MIVPTKYADVRITIKPIIGEDGIGSGYRAAAAETATDYGAHLGAAEAQSIRAALHKLAQDLAANPYTQHAASEAVRIVYLPVRGEASECSTSLIDWTFERATGVANKLSPEGQA